MNKEEIIKEVKAAENQLTSFLRRGEIMKGVAMHLKSPDYRNIWNGEAKTYDQLKKRLEKAIGAGLKSIDYQISDREFMVLNGKDVLETLTAIETTIMSLGKRIVSRPTAISILWQKIDGKWKLAYLHASEIPEQKREG